MRLLVEDVNRIWISQECPFHSICIRYGVPMYRESTFVMKLYTAILWDLSMFMFSST